MTNPSEQDKKKAAEIAKRIRWECVGNKGEIAASCPGDEVEEWVTEIVLTALTDKGAETWDAAIVTAGNVPCQGGINLMEFAVARELILTALKAAKARDGGKQDG